jgi:hypothetical protein
MYTEAGGAAKNLTGARAAAERKFVQFVGMPGRAFGPGARNVSGFGLLL